MSSSPGIPKGERSKTLPVTAKSSKIQPSPLITCKLQAAAILRNDDIIHLCIYLVLPQGAAGSPQQCEPITVGPYHLTHPVEIRVNEKNPRVSAER